MKYTWIDEGLNSGPVSGFGRDAGAGEQDGTTELGLLIYSKDNDFYEVVDGVFTAKTLAEVDAIKAQREADAQTEADRKDGIETAQGTSGLKQYTVEQVSDYLDNRFAAMVDLDSVKVELRKILDKMVPYLLG